MNYKNLGLRVLVGIFGVPVILGSIWIGKLGFVALVLIIVIISQLELYKLGIRKGTLPLKSIGIIGGIFLVLSFYYYPGEYTILVLLISSLLAFLIELFRNKPNPILNLNVTLGGLIYPAFVFSFSIFVREIHRWTDFPEETGRYLLLAILISTWICDTAAFFIGSKLGRKKLFPRVSPNKTIEGATGGFIFAILAMWGVHVTFFSSFPLVHLLVCGAICGSFGQIGDLMESLLKRDAGVKDSSNILPGHGGFLDRFDSIFITMPVTYIYFKIFL